MKISDNNPAEESRHGHSAKLDQKAQANKHAYNQDEDSVEEDYPNASINEYIEALVNAEFANNDHLAAEDSEKIMKNKFINSDLSSSHVIGYQVNINPINEIAALYERLLAAEQAKVAQLEQQLISAKVAD